jgi:hypothetical protein
LSTTSAGRDARRGPAGPGARESATAHRRTDGRGTSDRTVSQRRRGGAPRFSRCSAPPRAGSGSLSCRRRW